MTIFGILLIIPENFFNISSIFNQLNFPVSFMVKISNDTELSAIFLIFFGLIGVGLKFIPEDYYNNLWIIGIIYILIDLLSGGGLTGLLWILGSIYNIIYPLYQYFDKKNYF